MAAARTFGCGFSLATTVPERQTALRTKLFPTLLLYGGNCPAIVSCNDRRGLKVSACAVESKPSGRKPTGIMRPRRVSPELQELVGEPEISRAMALKVLWAHIKQNNLQNPSDRRIIMCDEKLKKIFGGRESVKFLEIAGLITPHFL